MAAMERATVDVYEREADRYRQRRLATDPEGAIAFAARLPAGAVRADVGCGPGRYTSHLGQPALALDAARSMLELTRHEAPAAWLVQADVEAQPLRRGALGGAWSRMCYQHLPRERLPMALADLHHAVAVGGIVELTVSRGTAARRRDDTDFPGRWFTDWTASHLADLVAGAGFEPAGTDEDEWHVVTRAVRLRSLADTVGPGMRVLVCGLNPSLYAADAGVPFARPGNRFWPAALAAGLVSRDRDPRHALADHGVGLTDLVKRATARSSDLTAEEYRAGFDRVERLAAWLRPGVVVFAGLEGWRHATGDRAAAAGPSEQTVGGRPAYLLPSPSGANAHARLDDLVAHLQAVAVLASPFWRK